MNPQTTKFNVGGTILEISTKLLLRFPSSPLCAYAQNVNGDNIIFLDYNPYAFLTLLDYLRTNQLLIPRNVNANLVKLIFHEFNIPFPTSFSLDKEETLLPNAPPAYQEVSSSRPAYVDSTQSVVGSRATSYDPLQTLDPQQRVLYKRLEPLVFQRLLPAIYNERDLGVSRLQIILLPEGVDERNIANDLREEGCKIIFQRLSTQDPEFGVMTQPKTIEILVKMLKYGANLKECSINIRNLAIRIQNVFGLFESKNFDLIVLELKVF